MKCKTPCLVPSPSKVLEGTPSYLRTSVTFTQNINMYLAAAFSRGVLSAQNKFLIFPLPAHVPSKWSSPNFEKLRHGPEIRHFVWPREGAAYSMATA